MPALSILLIDDDRNAIEMMRVLLARSGFKGALKTVPHAAAALQFVDETMAKAAPPQIIIIDLSLPGIHGFDGVRELRKKLGHSATFIAVLSASANPDDVHAAFSVGADAYFEKFPTIHDLRQIRETLESGEPLPRSLRILRSRTLSPRPRDASDSDHVRPA